MSTGLALRDYQHAANSSVAVDLAAGLRRVAVVLPTGTGKTVTFASEAARMAERGERTLVLAHRDELVNQARHKLLEIQPDLQVGIVKAERNEANARDAVVASVHSLVSPARRAKLFGAGRFARVVVDECHHAVAKTYVDILTDAGCFDPDASTCAVGYTATLGRGDGLALGKVWEKVSYQMDILDAIRAGHLIDVRGLRVTVKGLDLDQVARTAGDYQDDAMGRALIDADAPQAIAKAYLEHASDRQGIAFAPSVDMAHATADALNAVGITSASIWGAQPLDDRRAVLADFYAGKIQVLSNCMVLTEGFDAPQASCVVIARPTSSAPLYVQMVGRVLRPFPGQSHALVLDVVGVGGRIRLAGMADLAGVEVPEGSTIVEAVAEAEAEAEESAGRIEKASRLLKATKLHATEFDLFGESRRAWLRTDGGAWFLSAGEYLIFLAPGTEPGRFHVAKCSTKTQGGQWLREDCDLSLAMSWGEQFAAEISQTLTSRKSGWRKLEPTDGQRDACRSLGIITDGRTRGEVSDDMSIRIASRRLDRLNMFRSAVTASSR